METSVGVDLALKGSKHLETGVGFGEICRTVVCVKVLSVVLWRR